MAAMMALRGFARSPAVIVVVAAIAAGCLPSPMQAPKPPSMLPVTGPIGLDASNGTKLDVRIVVNGLTVATLAPGSNVEEIPQSEMPPMPWTIEALSPSGRVLTSLVVWPGDVSRALDPSGGDILRGAGARVDLSCGRLDLWVGPPMIGPAPGPGVAGDCEP